MSTRRAIRIALLSGVGLASAACATTSPDVFARQARAVAEEAKEAGDSDRAVCPVVVSNAADHPLEAGYALRGERSRLGLIPAGRSLSFQVSCEARRIEAFATAPGTGFMGGPEEYRTAAALSRTHATRVSFTLIDRVH